MHDRTPRPSGWFQLRVYRHGELVDVVDEANVVVAGASAINAQLIGGASGMAVTQLGVGTSGAPALASNTALTGAFLTPLGTPTYPVAGQVAFPFTLASNQANGMSIFEFGLVTAGGLLYARKVRGAPIAKTSSISFSGTWTIQL